MKLIGLDTEGVFPTHVGVFPAQQATDTPDRRLPHARGGVSTIYGASSTVMPSSPRTWGCFFSSGAVSMTRFVFPTHVGVFLKKPVGKRIRRRLPHARGGVSTCPAYFRGLHWSSPRTWGCFPSSIRKKPLPCVFPTHVGVFLFHPDQVPSISGLPHARGGVSRPVPVLLMRCMSSPRTWGCF